LEAFAVTLVAVLLSEIGDKTQLLTLLLVARFKRPTSVLAGLTLSGFASSAVAVTGGEWLRATFGGTALTWLAGILFLLIAALMLLPEGDGKEKIFATEYGAFVVSFISLFMANFGDKSQLTTVALAAKFHSIVPIIAGATLGPVLVNIPVVFLGRLGADRMPYRLLRITSSVLFAISRIGLLARA
jgi:putative Ca2+/H+ antiporter (TMEM165/GDT1 family)